MSAPPNVVTANRDDTASLAALLVFVLLGLTGLVGTPKTGPDAIARIGTATISRGRQVLVDRRAQSCEKWCLSPFL